MVDMVNLLSGSNRFNGLNTFNHNPTHLINMLYRLAIYDPNSLRLNPNPLTSCHVRVRLTGGVKNFHRYYFMVDLCMSKALAHARNCDIVYQCLVDKHQVSPRYIIQKSWWLVEQYLCARVKSLTSHKSTMLLLLSNTAIARGTNQSKKRSKEMEPLNLGPTLSMIEVTYVLMIAQELEPGIEPDL